MRPLKKVETQSGVFSKIVSAKIPDRICFDIQKKKVAPISISFTADGEIPFPQVIFRINGNEFIYNKDKIKSSGKNTYTVDILDNSLPIGTCYVQIEGCRKKDWQQSNGDDWIKWFGEFQIYPEETISKVVASSSGIKKKH